MKKTIISVLASILGLFVGSANAQIEPEMVLIQAACVELGSLSIGQQSNPLREVCIESFYINRYEVTFSEYDEFTRETGLAARHDLGFGRESRPVVDVNWFDAVAYADWLSSKTGEKYRLPTDAEWEYVARAGAELGFKYSWGAELVPNLANCKDCGSTWGSQMSAPVGSFEPNSFGVYDMHGNVWEWTSDCFYTDSPKKVRDLHCKVGVVRGGSWDVPATEIAFTVRAVQQSENTAANTGFRLVREL